MGLREDDNAVLPMIVIVVIIGAILLFSGLIIFTFTLGTILALVLVGAGLYLILKPEKLAGMGPMMKIVIPMVMIGLGLAVFAGWL